MKLLCIGGLCQDFGRNSEQLRGQICGESDMKHIKILSDLGYEDFSQSLQYKFLPTLESGINVPGTYVYEFLPWYTGGQVKPYRQVS